MRGSVKTPIGGYLPLTLLSKGCSLVFGKGTNKLKTTLLLTTICLSLFTSLVEAAQTAQGRMYCLSVRFSEGDGPFGFTFLNLTGIGSGINGELYPVSGQSRSHFSAIVLRDELFEEEHQGSLFLDVPNSDGNGDGFPDFLDVSQAVTGSSSGTYSLPGHSSGNVSASWSRSSGSDVGVCELTLQSVGTFTHTFNILEYKGPVTYTPGASLVAASVDFTLAGAPDSVLKGPLSLEKSESDPYDELTMDQGSWTNASGTEFFFLSDTVERDSSWPTNYFGVIEFDDWQMDFPDPDYYLWILSIDDLNDADNDGIPDFSDDASVVAPRTPEISVHPGAGVVVLTISGDVGTACQILESSSLSVFPSTNWPPVLSFTLTNDPHVVSLPISPGNKFWRVRVP